MGIPEVLMIVLYAMNIGEHLAKNGEPKEGKYDFKVSIFATAIAVGILYWGGFFS